MGEQPFRGRIIIFSIIGCPHCFSAKSQLRERGLAFAEVSVDQYEASVRMQLFERTGCRSLPQIFFNERFVGGSSELAELLADPEEWEKTLEYLKTKSPGPTTPSVPDNALRIENQHLPDIGCEPDEYALLVGEMKADGVVKDIRRGFTKYTNCFTGSQLVEWLVAKKTISREKAVEMGQALISRHFGHAMTANPEEIFHPDETIYRLLEDDDSDALNSGNVPASEPLPPGQLSEELRRHILRLFENHVTADGKQVDYKKLGTSEEFEKFVRFTRELHRVNIVSATREEKLAFFINVYNCLVIHALVVKGPPTNMFQRWKFFNTVRYIIGGYDYNLQDIENGVLRSNRRGVGQFFRPFGKNDPRLQVALDSPEPLVHFALVCGATSCPPIRTYSAKGIDDQLLMAAQSFLESDSNFSVDVHNGSVQISLLFKWYRCDFGKNDREVLKWIESILPEGSKRNDLRTVLENQHIRVTYKSYDWSLNSKADGRRQFTSRQRGHFGKDSCHRATFVFYGVVILTLVILGVAILVVVV